MAPPIDVDSPASVESSSACLSASLRLNIIARVCWSYVMLFLLKVLYDILLHCALVTLAPLSYVELSI